MATVIAKFISRRQADDALRSLRASGFAAELLDYPAGGDEKVRRLGDFRLTVPEPEADNALSVLSEIYADAPVHEGAGASTTRLSAAAVVLTPAHGADAPWLSLKRKSSMLSELLGIVSIPFAVVAALALAGVVLKAVYNLITYGSVF
jgi:hypothetical protein